MARANLRLRSFTQLGIVIAEMEMKRPSWLEILTFEEMKHQTAASSSYSYSRRVVSKGRSKTAASKKQGSSEFEKKRMDSAD